MNKIINAVRHEIEKEGGGEIEREEESGFLNWCLFRLCHLLSKWLRKCPRFYCTLQTVSVYSVTRFGAILATEANLKRQWQFSNGLLSIWPNL